MKKNAALRNGKALLFCLAVSALGLLFCSQCSPLYPLNVWGDANCLLTVGRVMREGGVLYRDIYEQKGPTLYLLHEVAAWIADDSFLGVYVLEVIAFAIALFFAWRIAGRKAPGAAQMPLLAAVALMAACVLTSASFSRGDSAEEFCLPLLLGAMDVALAGYEKEGAPLAFRRMLVCGIFAGVVATIKYTLLGLWIGLCLSEGIVAIRQGGLARIFRSAGAFLLGMMLPILAWGVYFAWHGALGDALEAYVINNIFLYSTEESATIKDALRILRDNALWALPAFAGTAFFVLRRKEPMEARLCLLMMAACQSCTVFLLGRVWPYSPLAMAPFAALGVAAAMRVNWAAFIHPAYLRKVLCAVSCLAALLLAWVGTPNAFLRGQKLQDLAQGRLAGYIEPGATLLQYSHLDDGLYLTSGALPTEKYFVRLNVDDPQMQSELDRYVREAIPDYVLVTWRELPAEFDRYQLIATDAGYDERNRINKLFYLYRRKSE